MNVKIKHVYGETEDAAMRYSAQNPLAPDGDDGRVVTATVRNAPSVQAAIKAANDSVFVGKLHSVDYAVLGSGRIVW